MPRNIEIKARVVDLMKLRSKVSTLTLKSPQRLEQKDTFFVASEGRLKVRCFADGSGELIAYSRTDSTGPKESAFRKLPCPDPAAMERTLSLALGIRGVVEKSREVFLVGQTRIHLDAVVGLGSFLELEVVLREDQTVEEGHRIARELLDRLEISPQDLIAVSYIDLLEIDLLEDTGESQSTKRRRGGS